MNLRKILFKSSAGTAVDLRPIAERLKEINAQYETARHNAELVDGDRNALREEIVESVRNTCPDLWNAISRHTHSMWTAKMILADVVLAIAKMDE